MKRKDRKQILMIIGIVILILFLFVYRTPAPQRVQIYSTKTRKILEELKHSLEVESDDNDDDDDDDDDDENNQENLLNNNEEEGQGILTTKLEINHAYDIDPKDIYRKYFVYQPSGGWGNQRMILRWALRLANAMERTLIVPMVAPHNKMWYGYDRLNATDMIPADLVLDMEALEAGTTHGVRVHREHLRELVNILPGEWKRNSKTTSIWLKENAIKYRWKGLSSRVVFWNQGSMWECCAGGTRMTPYVMFSKKFKEISLHLTETFFKNNPYNAVHMRRGGGHTRLERRTAQHYLDMKLNPANFEKSIPIYIATDEKNKSWFDTWRIESFQLIFWQDLMKNNNFVIQNFLSNFPERTHNDVIGFLEQLICARARKWVGSAGSTFSFSIEGMRAFPSLINIDWKENQDEKSKGIYAHDGIGIDSPVVGEQTNEEITTNDNNSDRINDGETSVFNSNNDDEEISSNN